MSPISWTDISETWFHRIDETDDDVFYAQPRLVAHIDPATIDALTSFYAEIMKPAANVLDLMSSWISHLPADLTLGRVSGLGLNAEELEANPRLDDWVVHNLNVDPNLPYPSSSFDIATIAVSIQYLTRPLDVLKEARRVLRPGGSVCIAMSHRLFPTKAIAAFRQLPPPERIKMVSICLEEAGFHAVDSLDRSPANADPLWLVVGTA